MELKVKEYMVEYHHDHFLIGWQETKDLSHTFRVDTSDQKELIRRLLKEAGYKIKGEK